MHMMTANAATGIGQLLIVVLLRGLRLIQLAFFAIGAERSETPNEETERFGLLV